MDQQYCVTKADIEQCVRTTLAVQSGTKGAKMLLVLTFPASGDVSFRSEAMFDDGETSIQISNDLDTVIAHYNQTSVDF